MVVEHDASFVRTCEKPFFGNHLLDVAVKLKKGLSDEDNDRNRDGKTYVKVILYFRLL